MAPIRRFKPGTNVLYADDLNRMAKVTEQIENLSLVGGEFSFGSSGLTLNIPEYAQTFIGIAGVDTGSYPTFNNSRKVFPVLLYCDPSFDEAAPTDEMTNAFMSVPEVQVYNLAECWIFEDTKLQVTFYNGKYWVWHNQKRTGVSAAAITKGNTGNVTVLGITITARAKFADTANGKAVSVYHDGTEWVIDAEECP
jgi:hypothetical protein